MKRLPPLKALRAFEAAARHMSFKAAADELALTPTAISHQIRLLETALGRALFRRRPRPLTLTPAGAALFPVVRKGFDSIAEAFAMVRREDVSRRLEAIDAPGGMPCAPATSEQLDEKPVSASTQLVRASPIERSNISGELVPSVHHQGLSSPRLSLVVLPFADVGGDHEQEYFADGITESLTVDLSRISGAFVIARNTAFAYKSKAIDLRQIGRDLNVRYGLEGSVQRGGNRLRLNVQLIDCDTRTHLWAERFDKELGDLFEMQDDIVTRIAGQLGAQLVEAEARRAEGALDPDSMDLYFRARAHQPRIDRGIPEAGRGFPGTCAAARSEQCRCAGGKGMGQYGSRRRVHDRRSRRPPRVGRGDGYQGAVAGAQSCLGAPCARLIL
jgi:TolB-like protein